MDRDAFETRLFGVLRWVVLALLPLAGACRVAGCGRAVSAERVMKPAATTIDHRQTDILIIGSGGATHNLREYFRPQGNYDSFGNFSEWLHDVLRRNDRETLLDYRERAPEGARNHPTEEHFLPLFVALGAGGARAERLHHSFDRSLCMDAYRFDD